MVPFVSGWEIPLTLCCSSANTNSILHYHRVKDKRVYYSVCSHFRAKRAGSRQSEVKNPCS